MQPHERKSYSFTQERIELFTEPAQHVAARKGEIVDESLLKIVHHLYNAMGAKHMDKVVEMIEDSYKKMAEELNVEIRKARKLLEDNGASKIQVRNDRPHTIIYKSHDPMTTRYYVIIKLFDQLIHEFNRLRHAEIFTIPQVKKARDEWQRKIMQLGEDIYRTKERAWKAAQTKEEKAKKAAPQNEQKTEISQSPVAPATPVTGNTTDTAAELISTRPVTPPPTSVPAETKPKAPAATPGGGKKVALA